MAKRKTRKEDQEMSTAQQLGSLIKSTRDIMRKDKGLNGDLDRLPMLTWLMFLKFLDDMEKIREQESEIANKRFRNVIESPYRWRDWASQEDGITGTELIAFINQDEAVRPDGSKGLGLFSYLRDLQSTEGIGREEVVANVFRGVANRMESGYLLRDVINKVSGIHFNSSEESLTLGRLYESMLREMRDAAGDAGEFYTPRPVVQLMVSVTNPRLGETILDPASGTGGFLCESFDYVQKQCTTVEQQQKLQQETIYGREAKSLPYLLSQMNLLLHGLEYPKIDYGNSLAEKISEIGERERVDIVLTNPPFGGEEESSIRHNFPADMQTSETALLFLQLIMRKLKRPSSRSLMGGRAAVVVPNGTLFGRGVCARIKGELVRNFNLHTIVRLGNGVFTPYTPVPTNILFFDRSGPTESIWFYQHPFPEGRKNYTKTKALRFREFEPLIEWWQNRNRNEHAWLVPIDDILEVDEQGKAVACNLDLQHPDISDELDEIDSSELITSILEKEKHLTHLLQEVKGIIES